MLRCAQALPALSRSDRENEAVAVLKEFTEAAYGALVGINFVELERHLITLVYAANRLSVPPPAPSPDTMVRRAMAIGWSADEIDMRYPLTYVSKQLGHSKPTTTLSYYAHWIPSGDTSYADALDEPAMAPTFGIIQQNLTHSQRESGEMQLTGS